MDLEFDSRELNRGQKEFLLSVAPFVCFAGGYGSGKSTALALKVLSLVIQNRGLPGLLIAQNFGALETNVLHELWRIIRNTFPEHLHPKHIRDPKNPRLIFPNGRLPSDYHLTKRKWDAFEKGSVVYLRSAENPAGYEGISAAWVCGDEIRYWDKKAYEVAVSRARLRAAPLVQRCFATTPSMNWVADEFNGTKPFHQLITAGTLENARNLSEDYIAGLRSSYSSRLQRAVLDGEFTILEGAVFEAFEPNFNKPNNPWAEDFKPDRDYLANHRTYLAHDPGFRRSAWLWWVETKKQDWVCFDELMPENRTDMQQVEAVNAKKHPVDEIWVDPAADATNLSTGTDVFATLKEIKVRGGPTRRPIRCPAGFTTDIPWGIDKMRVLLGGEGLPVRWRFARSLCAYEASVGRGIIRDLGASKYPEMKDGRAVLDLPEKDGKTDHARDAARYFAAGLWCAHPQLRSKDPHVLKMAQHGAAGFRQVA